MTVRLFNKNENNAKYLRFCSMFFYRDSQPENNQMAVLNSLVCTQINRKKPVMTKLRNGHTGGGGGVNTAN